jgi:hypothetical protein
LHGGRPGDVHEALYLLVAVLGVFMVVLALTTPRYLRRYAQARLGRAAAGSGQGASGC